MKKILIVATSILILYSCSKKIAPTITKAVSKPVEEVVCTKVLQPTNKVQKVENTNAKDIPAITPAAINDTKPLPTVVVPKEPAQVALGGEIYRVKCNRCHELKDPEEYNAAKWVKLVEWMAPRAKLDAAEKDNVIAYVSFYAKK